MQVKTARVTLNLYRLLSNKLKRQVGVLVFVLFISAICELFSLGMVIPFISVVYRSSDLDINHAPFLIQKMTDSDPFTLVLIFTIGILISTLFRTYCTWSTGIVSANIGNHIALSIIQKYLNSPYEISSAMASSTIVSLATKYTDELILVALSTMQLLGSTLLSLVLFLGIVYASPMLALTIFSFFGLVYFLISNKTKSIVVYNSRVVATIISRQIQVLQEAALNLKYILLGSHQQFVKHQFSELDKEIRRKNALSFFIGYAPKFLLESTGILILVIGSYIIIQSYQNISSEQIIAQIAVVAFASQKLLPALQQIYNTVSVIKSKDESIQRITRYLNNQAPECSDTPKILTSTKHFPLIELRRVNFFYDSNPENTIIKSLNITIKHGEKIGIVGPSGSGKSTLVDLMIGLLKPKDGLILINGQDLWNNDNNINKSWMNSISYIPQFCCVLNNTIAANIAFGVPDNQIDYERVAYCSRIACIDEYIQSLPDTYHENILDNGANLSGGQIQRIGIARSLYSNGDVIVMDESTSALDKGTEGKIMQNISSLQDKTIIIITHRDLPLSFCEKIYSI